MDEAVILSLFTSNLNGFQSEQPRPSRHRRTDSQTDSQTDSIVSTASTIAAPAAALLALTTNEPLPGNGHCAPALSNIIASVQRPQRRPVISVIRWDVQCKAQHAVASSYEQFNDMIDRDIEEKKEKEAAPDYDYDDYDDYEEEEKKTMYLGRYGPMSMVNEYQDGECQASPEATPEPEPLEVDDGDHGDSDAV